VTETTIPLLPCTSPESTVEFFDALGFYVERQQTRPYLYMTFRFGDFALHFKDAPRNLNSQTNCLVMVDAVDAYHRTFSAGLRRRYGRMPTVRAAADHPAAAGPDPVLPLRPNGELHRLHQPNRTRYRIRRLVVDVGSGQGPRQRPDPARLQERRRARGARPRRRAEPDRDAAPRVDVARGLADRVELAIALGDREAAEVHRDQLLSMGLSAAERAAIAVQLRAIDDLERWLSD
jgi:hypothetical protein